MKKHLWEMLTATLFGAVLLLVPLYWLLVPPRTFSASERRYLAELPDPSKQDPANWTFDDEFESYLADHLPMRDALVGTNAYVTLYTGRQVSAPVWRDDGGYLLEAPVAYDATQIEKRLARIARLGETTGLKPYVLAVPSTGYIHTMNLPASLRPLYKDAEAIAQIEAAAGITFVPIAERFMQEGQAWYYRTDHHWTADGAFAAYEAFMAAADRPALDHDAFYHHSVAGYYGSTRSRSALWLTDPDTLCIDEPIGADVSVTFSDDDAVYNSLFFYDHLEEYDWYPLFLDGNHPITVIENRAADADAETLLMVKDSFGNTLAPLLVPSYRTVVLVDPRYYRGAVSELCAMYNADELLFCYSLERLCTDRNLQILK